MGILSKLTRTMRIRKYAKKLGKVYEALCLSPLKYSRAIAEIDCIIDGHKQSSEFDPKRKQLKALLREYTANIVEYIIILTLIKKTYSYLINKT